MGLFSWLFGKKDKKEDKKEILVPSSDSNAQLESLLSQKETELSKIQDELAKTKSILSKLQSESENSHSSDSDSKVSNLLSNISELKKDLEAKEKEMNALSEKFNLSDAQVKSLTGNISDLKNELDQKISECKELLNEKQKVEETNKQNLDKIKNQDKKIKDLEEAIEDYEDDIKGLKKKVTTAEEENRKLDSKLHDCETNLRRSEEENRENQAKLRLADNEIKQLQDSGDFISSLLKAKTVDGKSKEIEKAVYSIQRFVKQELNPLYHRIFEIDEYRAKMVGKKNNSGFDMLETWAAQTCKTWLDNKKVISFIGEFSAGKTTIVNSILKSGNANATELPTSSKATTAIPTYISDGKIAKYTFVSDGVRKEIDKVRFEKTSKETLGKIEGISSLITYFVMEYSNPNLSGLSILDTPGFDSNDEDDAKRTLGVVNESDALFWVVDVNRGELNKNSIDVIKNGLSKPLYIIINQCDGKSSAEIDSTKSKIQMTVKNYGLNVKGYITYGKGMPIENIMSVIRSLDKSNTNNYLYDLQSMVRNDVSMHSSIVSDDRRKIKKCEDDIDDAENKFENNLQYLVRQSTKACDIPRFDNHDFNPFKDPEYRMTVTQFNSLRSCLSGCKDTCSLLRSDMRKYGKLVQIKTNSMNILAENKQVDAELRTMVQMLDALIVELEKVQRR